METKFTWPEPYPIELYGAEDEDHAYDRDRQERDDDLVHALEDIARCAGGLKEEGE